MGPYTTQNIDYFLKDNISIDDSQQDLGAFDPSCDMHTVLGSVVGTLRDNYGVNAFIATDANVPLPKDAPQGVDALTQSIEYAKASDATAFVLPYGGVRDGVDIEIGSVLENRIEPDNLDDEVFRYHIFREKRVSSQTLRSLEQRYDVTISKFDSRLELGMQFGNFMNSVTEKGSEL